MLRIGPRTKNLLLGTATPIQTEVSRTVGPAAHSQCRGGFVLGRETFGRWADWQQGAAGGQRRQSCPWTNATPGNGCAIRCRRATRSRLFASLRLQLGIPDNVFFTDRGFGSLGFFEQQAVLQTLGARVSPRAQPDRPPHRPAPPADAGRGRPAGQGRGRRPSRSRSSPPTRIRAWALRAGLADEPSLRPRLPGGGGLHGGPAEAHQGGWVHEDALAAAHLLELCLGQVDRRRRCCAGKFWRTRTRRPCSPNRSAP